MTETTTTRHDSANHQEQPAVTDKKLSWIQKSFLWLIGSVVLYTTIGFFVLPPVIKAVLQKKLPVLLSRQVTVEKIRLNPFALTASIEGFSLQNRTGDDIFVAFDLLQLDLQLASIVHRAPVVQEVLLKNPKVKLTRFDATTFNFSDLLSAQPKEAPASPDAKPFLFSINNIEITGGNITFSDLPKEKIHRVTQLTLAIPSVSNLPYQVDEYIQPAFSGTFNDTPFSLKGKSKPFSKSQESFLDLSISDINLPVYLAYVPNTTPLTLRSGRLDIATALSFQNRPDTVPALLIQGQVVLRDLDVVDPSGTSYLALPRMTIDIAPSSLLEKVIAISQISIEQPILQVRKLKNNDLLPLSLLPEPPAAELADTPSSSVPDTTPALPPVQLTVQQLLIKQGVFTLADESVDLQTTLSPIDLTLNNLSTNHEETAAYELTLSTESGELLALTGTAQLFPVAVSGKLAVSAIQLSKYNPYITTFSGPAGPQITGGTLDFSTQYHFSQKKTPQELQLDTLQCLLSGLNMNMNGATIALSEASLASNLSLKIDPQQLKLDALQGILSGVTVAMNGASLFLAKAGIAGSLSFEEALRFQGNSQLGELALADQNNTQVLRLQGVSVEGIDLQSKTNALTIQDINIQAPSLAVVVRQDGLINLTELAKSLQPQNPDHPQEEDRAPAKQSSAPEVHIENIAIKDATLGFQDYNIQPSFAATMRMDGSVAGLSTDADSTATLQFKGKLNDLAPITIAGTMKPLQKDLTADLAITFDDIDLSPTSPYTGKFIGYKVDKGKLTLNINYTLAGKNITAGNHIFLDQFTLGESVESPDAANLPIKLALALLQNRSGEIILDIPVAGNLDDPEFSVGGVVVQVLFNLIAKAVTSPFALLGALIPDGEDLDTVTFAPGSAEVEPTALDKIERIAKILFERPGLRMDIIGKADPEKDRQNLLKTRFNQLLLQQMRLDNPDLQDEEALAIESGSADYQNYLEKAYNFSVKQKKSGFDKALFALSSFATEPPPQKEMEEHLLAEVAVSDDTLRLLAQERANKVMSLLIAKGPIEAGRLFIIEPQLSQATDGTEALTQVDMLIK